MRITTSVAAIIIMAGFIPSPGAAETIAGLTIFLDAYIDRASNAEGTGLRADDIDECDWIVIGHSHFDHLYGAERIMANMSQRGAEMLREEMEYMQPQRRRVIEEAQTKIVAVVRKLEEAGEIVISRGGDEEIVV